MRARQSVELRQLRYFVTLAEELNFRRAAERLFITQPSLSHQIALLESGLGSQLFQRDRRGVSLTIAGAELLEDAKRLLADSEAIMVKARRAAASATLRVGYPEFANRTLIPRALSLFREEHPEVKVQLCEGYSGKSITDLRAGKIDIAFVMLPSAKDLAGLEVEILLQEKTGLLLAATHGLAVRSEITIEAIADEPLLVVSRSVNAPVHDAVVEWFSRSGLEARLLEMGTPGVYSYETALRVIESGDAVALSPESMFTGHPSTIVWRPIDGDAPPFELGAVWLSENRSSAVANFVEVLREARPIGRGYQLTESRH